MVGHLQGQKIGVGAANADFADANLRLHGVGLVNQPDMRGCGVRGHLRRVGHDVELRPAAEIFFGDGEGFFRSDVAGETEQRLIRRVVRIVKFHEIFALQFLHRGWSALLRQAVGRIAIERAREGQRRQIIRVGILHFEVGEKLLALTVEFFGAETRDAVRRQTSDPFPRPNLFSRRRA